MIAHSKTKNAKSKVAERTRTRKEKLQDGICLIDQGQSYIE